jgi:hypothetical protein
MNASEMTFGIEIETCLPPGLVACGGYHAGYQIAGLPQGWNAQRDCSIRGEAGLAGVEVVSPVLKGADGLRQVVTVAKWLNEHGAKVNSSTGFHVHVGWTGDDAALDRLVHIVANYEKALLAATGTHSRDHNHFCQSVRTDAAYVQRLQNGNKNCRVGNRYHVLNLTNLGTAKNTVEFRVFAGTTNAVKIVAYIRLCLAMVEKALRMRKHGKWIGKKPVETSPLHHKGGEGQTEMTRLFYFLGWTKGQENYLHGNVTDEAVPAIEEGKKELMRLAKKYDARAQARPASSESFAQAMSYGTDHIERWERRLFRGQRVRVHLPDGTNCEGQFVRRYTRSLVVRVSHIGEELIRVPRVGARTYAENNRITPA